MSNSSKSRMGGFKLGDFDKTQPVSEPEVEQVEPTRAEKQPEKQQQPKPRKQVKDPKVERLVTVNIKILESQQDWLADTAKKVRQNNDAPVAAPERVYPQHLIQAAIALLQSSDVDWGEVRNISDLKKQLDL